jgi:hypothetical protein
MLEAVGVVLSKAPVALADKAGEQTVVLVYLVEPHLLGQ